MWVIAFSLTLAHSHSNRADTPVRHTHTHMHNAHTLCVFVCVYAREAVEEPKPKRVLFSALSLCRRNTRSHSLFVCQNEKFELRTAVKFTKRRASVVRPHSTYTRNRKKRKAKYYIYISIALYRSRRELFFRSDFWAARECCRRVFCVCGFFLHGRTIFLRGDATKTLHFTNTRKIVVHTRAVCVYVFVCILKYHDVPHTADFCL